LYWEGRVPSLDEYEASEFGWWKAINGVDSNCRILLRLFGNWYEEHRTGSLLSVHFDYDWLIVNTVDNDTDDIFDFLEDRGVMGTNKHIYYADSSLTDKDGDGLSDGKEFGELVVFANYNESTVTNSSTPVSGYTPTTKGKFALYVKMKSDPLNIDWDKDGALDSIDWKTYEKNEDVSYVVTYHTQKNSFQNLLFHIQEDVYCNLFRKFGLTYECIELDTPEDFMLFVGVMGYQCNDKSLHKLFDLNNYGNTKKYSEIRNLILIFHGVDTYDGIYFEDENEISQNWLAEDYVLLYFSSLLKFPIRHLDFQVCWAHRDMDGDGSMLIVNICLEKMNEQDR
jgi:hypothetical protein